MKRLALTFCLAAGVGSQLAASETLLVKLHPEREWLLLGEPQEVVVKIDLHAAHAKSKHERTPLNVAVVLDCSGSMSGAKIEKARQAAMLVVDQLSPSDILSVITYSDCADAIVYAQPIEDKAAIKSRLARIQAGGSTALYAGVKLGADQLRRHLSSKVVNRVILLSDGLANVGPSSPRDLRALGRELSEKGISVTTVGVGDDYNEELMAGLAESSDANYYYVKDTETLPRIFAKELGGLQAIAARDVRIEIICPDGVRPIGLIGRPETPNGQRISLYLSQFCPGQNRYAFLRCRVEKQTPRIAIAKVSYTDELNGGGAKSIEGVAVAQFTSDKVQAENSVRQDITLSKQLLLAAVAKDDAIADADAGRYQQAASKLTQQAIALEAQYQNAPRELQPSLRLEVENLKQQSQEFQQNRYSAGARKQIQNEAWNYRNSK